MRLLFVLAILPIIFLCNFVYKRDVNHEPAKLLIKIFALGFFSALPIVVLELLLEKYFPTSNVSNFITLFVNLFISVALIEELFKWVITKFLGYDSKEFDEIYDIIVYAVFSSLGFACIENILYVLSNGVLNALFRAILSIPGHTCFGIIMGYYLSQAKIAEINSKSNKYINNLILSILLPVFVHTLYDVLLLYSANTSSIISLVIFLILYIIMLIICFRIVDKMSHVQVTLNTNLSTGVLIRDEEGNLSYKPIQSSVEINFCPVCGAEVKGNNYCPYCGFHLHK